MLCKTGSSTESPTLVCSFASHFAGLSNKPLFVEVFQNAKPEEESKRKLFVVISSDKGLCGGIHSSVSKATRRSINTGENGGSTDSPIVVVGDKSKAQLLRSLASNFAVTFNQIGRDIPTFADAAGIADLIVKAGIKYDSIAIVYNKFISVLSYEPAVVEVLNEEVLKEAGRWRCSIAVWRTCLTSFSWIQGVRDGG